MSNAIGRNENLYAFPDERGHFGIFGGRFVSETLMAALETLEAEYTRLQQDKTFKEELQQDLLNYVGRASPLYFAERLTDEAGPDQPCFPSTGQIGVQVFHSLESVMLQMEMTEREGGRHEAGQVCHQCGDQIRLHAFENEVMSGFVNTHEQGVGGERAKDVGDQKYETVALLTQRTRDPDLTTDGQQNDNKGPGVLPTQ